MENIQEEKKKYEFGKAERPEQKPDSKYREAPPYIVEKANELIEKYHKHLERARISYLFYEESLKYRGKEVPGRVYKVHDRIKVKMKKDFIVVISEPKWEMIHNQNKEDAALDWILCFMTVGSNPDSWTTKDPDFSGFYNNVDRFGLWDRDLQNLEKRIKQTSIPLEPDNTESFTVEKEPQPAPEPELVNN